MINNLETILNTKPTHITIRYSIPASAQCKHFCICWGVRPALLDAIFEMSIQWINFRPVVPTIHRLQLFEQVINFAQTNRGGAMQSERCQTDALRSKATRRVYMRLHHKLTDNLKARQEEF